MTHKGTPTDRISISPLLDEAFLQIALIALSRRQEIVKRRIDIVGSVPALFLHSAVTFVAGMPDTGPR